MSFKVLVRASLCLLILAAFVTAQCPLIADRGYAESSSTNYEYMFHWGLCEGPSCPNGIYLFLGEGRGNLCPDEPATVWMSRNVQPTPKQGIVINFTVRGDRSGYLFRFGYIGIDCSGIGDLYEQQPYACLPCDSYIWSECEDRPGEGSRRAECGASTACTASCVKPTAHVFIFAWDYCFYQPWESHYCEAWASSIGGGINSAGSYAGAATYYQYVPHCAGDEVSKCNGYYSVYHPQCSCPNTVY